MDRGANINSNMEVNPCFNCVGSCCKPEVDLSRNEYEQLKEKGHGLAMQTRTDIFIIDNPNYEKRRGFLNEMYASMFAILTKGEDGFCLLLDRNTRLCSIYNDRPKACRDFESNGPRCKNLKECIN